MLQLLAYTLFQKSPGGHLKTQISGPYPQSLWSFGSGMKLVSLHLSWVPRWCFCCWSGAHTWGTTALSCLLKTERSNNIGILLGSVKIHKLFIHYVPGMMRAIMDSRPHLIGMVPAPSRSWSHSIMTTSSGGGQVSSSPLFHPWGKWRSQSMLCGPHSADHCVTTRTFHSPNPCVPLCLLPVYFSDVVTLFLTLRWIFLILLHVSILSCFSF